ncbi:FAD-binding protein [Mitsuaria sp. WAJ17]|uniref:FAD-binding oxidoreductase n=1 Tax=Mitsuaria sp. WAJ17 TaxID=2761452 RepID=UPI0016040015|nr:FAD-linked oxidase C-terminal domain-containing protein [Mitsuaria sp. WAJ17]MBB2485689.1 FAD-binding protein [Mitsuaria sp. WAJ17]
MFPMKPRIFDELRAIVGGRCDASEAVRLQHAQDESSYGVIGMPDVVVFPESIEEIEQVVRLAYERDMPIIPFGAGSSVEGHVLPVRGGVTVSLTRMNQILDICAEDMTVTVQAGVTRKQLNAALRDSGLFFPVDPGADATIGGMCATSASGTTTVRYGTMKENVLAMVVVLADGQAMELGRGVRKSSAGYDLAKLFIGSEGTLGIIASVTLRVHPLPNEVAAAVCTFQSLEDAVNVAIQVKQAGIAIARMELLNAETIGMVNRYRKADYVEAATLFVEFHGRKEELECQVAEFREIATDNRCLGFDWATRPEDRTKLWEARHHAYFAAIQSRPGARAISTDVCVPISKLLEVILESENDARQVGIPYFLVGHVGDGNFHFGYLIDPASHAERLAAERLNEAMVYRAIRLGGTCSGEHGIGLHKKEFLRRQVGDRGIDLMRAIKKAVDPKWLFNPMKVVDPQT